MSPTPTSIPASNAGTAKAQVKPNSYPRPGDMGNCVGCVLPKTSPLLSPPNNRPETEEEGWFDKFKQGAKDAAQYYKDNISESMHEFGANAMDTGGKVAMAGGATAAAGGMVAATGIGAPVGVAMGTAGGAAAAAGGVVGAVGAGTDSAATVLDTAATWITEGKPPDIVKPVVALGERVLTSIVLKKVPGLGSQSRSSKKSSSNGGAHLLKNCAALQNGLPGTGYRGGRHRDIKQGGNSYSPKRQSHHVPADSAYSSINGVPVNSDNKPTIQMDLEDHKNTASYDTKPGAAQYRDTQSRLMMSGKAGFAGALAMDIQDVESKFPGKYTSAIAQMMAWSKCMGYI